MAKNFRRHFQKATAELRRAHKSRGMASENLESLEQATADFDTIWHRI